MGNGSKNNDIFLNLDLLPYAKMARTRNREVWDPSRKIWVEQTPEEMVRQGLVQFLHEEKDCAFSKMRSEYQISYNSLRKRLDLIVFDKAGNPLLLAECKSWKVKLNHNTLKQAGIYNSVIKAPYLLVCNGKWALIAEINHKAGKSKILSEWPTIMNAKA